MTGKLDKRMRSTAQRLIDDFGKPVTLRRTEATFDPSTGKTVETTQDFDVNGVLEDYSENRVDGTLVKAGDLRLSIPARDLSVTPDIEKDTIRFGGDTWSIVNDGRVYSGEQVALHQLQIRR